MNTKLIQTSIEEKLFYSWLLFLTALLFLKAGVLNFFAALIIIITIFLGRRSLPIGKRLLVDYSIFIPLVFIGYALISIVWTNALPDDLRDSLSRLKFFLLIPVFYFSLNLLSDKYLQLTLKWLFILLSVNVFLTYGASIGFYELPGGVSMKNRIFFGLTTSVLVFWSLAGYLHEDKGFSKRVYYLIALSSIFSIFFIEDGRTGYLLTIIAVSAAFLSNIRAINFFSLPVIFILALTLFGLYYGMFEGRGLSDNDIHEKSGLNSIGLRFEFIKAGLLSFLDSPVIGHGLGSYRIAANNVSDLGFDLKNNPHSNFILVLVELGLIGLALFYGLFMKLFIVFKINECSLFLLGACFLLLIDSFINSTFFDLHPGYFGAFLIAFGLVLTSKKIKFLL